MAIYAEGSGLASEAEPVGLLTEGAAGIAVIVLAVIALAGVSVDVLASVLVIVAGVGFMLQAFNSIADHAVQQSRLTTAAEAAALPRSGFGSEAAVDGLCGLAVLILGILALVGVKTADLLPPALIVAGAALMIGGALGSGARRSVSTTGPSGAHQMVVYQGASAVGGMEVLIGLAAIVLGILAVMLPVSAVLVLVGFIAVGAALLLASASFSSALLRLFTAA